MLTKPKQSKRKYTKRSKFWNRFKKARRNTLKSKTGMTVKTRKKMAKVIDSETLNGIVRQEFTKFQSSLTKQVEVLTEENRTLREENEGLTGTNLTLRRQVDAERELADAAIKYRDELIADLPSV